MKKVFVIGYSENKGGVENYIDTLIKNISHDKIQIVLSMPIMAIDGVDWVRPKNRHNYIKYSSFWNNFFKANKFDAVYFNTCDIVGIDMLKFAKKAGVPIRIIHSHSSSNFRRLNFIHAFLEKVNRKKLHKYATHFLACSNTAGKWMFGAGQPFVLINNAIELSKFRYNAAYREKIKKDNDLENKFVIGMVGSLSPVKNPEFGVDVINSVVKKNENAALVMVGEGVLEETIKKKVNELGLNTKVKLLGRRNDVNEIMSAFDCFLMPSKSEGFPFVLVEAQASGLPCVVSDGISKETDLSGNVHFMSLEAAPAKWAEKILDVCRIEKREENIDVLKQQGYDIQDNIKRIERILLNEENNSKN